MRCLNGFRLLTENFRLVYKLLLYKLVIALVACALCCAFLLPELLNFWHSVEVQTLILDGKSFFLALLDLSNEEMTIAKEKIVGDHGSLQALGTLLASRKVEIILTCTGIVAVYLIQRFAETICHFTTGSMLNDKMSTYAETPFGTSSVANLGKATAYAALYVPVSFLFDALLAAAVYALIRVLPIFAGLFFGTTLLVVGQAFKLTLTVNWMPAMTADNKLLREAIRRGTKEERKQGIRAFSSYIVSVYAVIIINILAGVCTFGSALLITVPASYFFLICQQYVHYYTVKGKKYFITYERIATNPDCGDSEHFFDYIDKVEGETATSATQNAENYMEE